jgi:hypothetical protein
MPELRQAHVSDHSTIVECVQRWWGDSRTPAQARELSLLLPKLFLQFFSSTSCLLEDEAGIRAFLVGFHAADNDEEAYIHFVDRGQLAVCTRPSSSVPPRQAAQKCVRSPRRETPVPSPFTALWDSHSKAETEWSMVYPCTATTTALGRTGCASTRRSPSDPHSPPRQTMRR